MRKNVNNRITSEMHYVVARATVMTTFYLLAFFRTNSSTQQLATEQSTLEPS